MFYFCNNLLNVHDFQTKFNVLFLFGKSLLASLFFFFFLHLALSNRGQLK